jgi:hypothetical protein
MESELELVHRSLTALLTERLDRIEAALAEQRGMIEALASQPQVPRVKEAVEVNAAESEVRVKTPLLIEEVQEAPIERVVTPKRPVTAPVRNATPHEAEGHKEEATSKKNEELHKKAEEAKRKQAEAKHKQEQKKKEEKAAEKKKKDEETKAKEASKKAAADEKKAKELAEKKAKELASKQAKEQAAKQAKEEKAKKAEEAKASKGEESKKKEVGKKRPEDAKKDNPPISARKHKEPKHPEPKKPAEEPAPAAEEVKVEEQPAPDLVVEVEVADVLPPVVDAKAAELAKIEESFAQLRQTYDETQLTIATPFDISVGAKSALSLMNSMGPEKLYLDTYPPSKIVWAHRLFFQFRGISLAEDEHEAWDSIKVYLAEASKGNFGMC